MYVEIGPSYTLFKRDACSVSPTSLNITDLGWRGRSLDYLFQINWAFVLHCWASGSGFGLPRIGLGSRISNSCHQKFKDLNKVDAPFADWLIGGTMMHTHAESMGNLINIWFLRELVWFWFFCRSKFQKFRLFLSFLELRFGSFRLRLFRYPRLQLAYPVSKAVFSILKRAGWNIA